MYKEFKFRVRSVTEEQARRCFDNGIIVYMTRDNISNMQISDFTAMRRRTSFDAQIESYEEYCDSYDACIALYVEY